MGRPSGGPGNGNTLHTLVFSNGNCSDDEMEEYDLDCLKVMKRLRDMDSFKKEDITEYELWEHSCEMHCTHRFEFLVSWDPTILNALFMIRLVFYPVYQRDITNFEMGLRASLKYHPRELGFLFHGESPCDYAYIMLQYDDDEDIEFLSSNASFDCSN